MREQARWFLLAVAAAALGACASRPAALELANRPPETAQACADWRWIAVLDRPAATCPQARSGWKVERLSRLDVQSQSDQREKGGAYAAAAASDRDRKPAANAPSPQEAIAQLSRFCVYEVADGAQKARFPPVANPAVVRLDQDCAALALAAAPAIETLDWQPLAADFLAQVGKPAVPLAIKRERGVRLAFLDTQPTDDFRASTPPGNSLHGFTLAHIARQLVCSPAESETCAARITTRLALPLTTFDPHSRARTYAGRNGGYIGTQRDLAEAIIAEVDAWSAELDRPNAPQHLVLNLSLAWDPRLFAGLDEAQVADLRAGAQGVYRALQYAASRDVLVLAAAGNRKTCPDVSQDGPLLPAAWEIGGPRDASCGEASPRLVYAVGGLERGDQPVWNARPRSMPRRAAYADNAVVPAGNPDVPTALYSGTSVATAVASSIAAIVWDTLPDRGGPGVMKLVDGSGRALGLGADFWPGVANGSLAPPPVPKVRRLSLCDALRAACDESGPSACPIPPEPCPPLPAARELAGLSVDHDLPDTCQPWVFPQPEDPPCPTCYGDPPRR